MCVRTVLSTILIAGLLCYTTGCTTDTVVNPQAESSNTEATEQTPGKLSPGNEPPPRGIAASGELLIAAPPNKNIKVKKVRTGQVEDAKADCGGTYTWQQAAGRNEPLNNTGCTEELPDGFVGVNETVRIYTSDSDNWIYYRAHSSSAPDMKASLSTEPWFSVQSCNANCNAKADDNYLISNMLTAQGTYKSVFMNFTTQPSWTNSTACYIAWYSVFGSHSNKPQYNDHIKVWGFHIEDDPCEFRVFDWKKL